RRGVPRADRDHGARDSRRLAHGLARSYNDGVVDGTMKSRTAALVLGALTLGLGALTTAHGQESRPTPDIRMLLTQPNPRIAPDSPPAPDLRDLPQGKIDKPPTHPPITVIVGDPRCYPGEDGMIDPSQLGRGNRSRRFH